MSDFDARAREWDSNPMHLERSKAIASELKQLIPLNTSMSALEYGAGTALLSFLLKDEFRHIILMDNSQEMINVCREKTEYYRTSHISPVWFDLEHQSFDQKFDVILNQMVLHHVNDVSSIIEKFYALLNPEGYLAIADLYTEDGSFHGPEVNVHHGFDPEGLITSLKEIGFRSAEYKTCFEVERPSGMKYPIFLLVALK
jgi:ubiquinone/menaquinone biosynthesis C-methylase UbiE